MTSTFSPMATEAARQLPEKLLEKPSGLPLEQALSQPLLAAFPSAAPSAIEQSMLMGWEA